MKFLIAAILTALVAFVAGIWLSWWSIAIVALLIALIIPQKTSRAFWSGFLGIFLLWSLLALWINIKNQGILASKIAGILPLGGSAILIILVTGIVGGLVGAFGAMSGSFLRSSAS